MLPTGLERDVEPRVDTEERAGDRRHRRQPQRAPESGYGDGDERGGFREIEACPHRPPVLGLVVRGQGERQPDGPRDQDETCEREEGCDQATRLHLLLVPRRSSTAAPRMCPVRSRSSASFASSSGNTSTSVRIGTCGASARSSSPSRRVRFATDRMTRSPQSKSYGNCGMSLMWIPAQTTAPALRTARNASGTSAPTGAKMIAASSSTGGGCDDPPAQSTPSDRANSCPSGSSSRVNANTRRPWCRATWA